MTQRKIALVTGGSRGLGKDMAINLARKGLDLVITYHTRKEEADAVVAELEKNGARAVALPLPVHDSGSFITFFDTLKQTLQQRFGRSTFDFLVNNAGSGLHKAFAETTADELDSMFAIHFKAPFLLAQQSLPLLHDGGAIVNISSGLARFSFPGYAAYASMKSAVETLSRYQAKELGSRGIRVNTVAPGAIATDFGGGAVRDNEELNRQIASVTALGRVGLPQDIGSVVAFLCTDEARWINAQRIEVSGGMML